MTVDPFRLAIALVPVAAYVLLLGLDQCAAAAVSHLRRQRPDGAGRRAFRLDVRRAAGAVSPEAATREFGNYIWLFLLVFYWLWLLLVVLLSRPRLVVYNISMEELHPVLAETAAGSIRTRAGPAII